MSFNEKPGGGGEMQPYVPAGNGDKSGEYTNKSYESFEKYSKKFETNKLDSKSFCEQFGCNLANLKRLLTPDEYEAVRNYSFYKVGVALNKAIREGKMSAADKYMLNKITTAINKFYLKEELLLHRGITVSKEVYLKKFYEPYINGYNIYGSKIASTSKSYIRALYSAMPENEESVGLLFTCVAKKGSHALPIEDIANDSTEQEVLLAEPIYHIKNIKETRLNGKIIYNIEIVLL